MRYRVQIESIEFYIRVDVMDKRVFPSLRKVKNGTRSDLSYKISGVHELLKGEKIESYCEPMAGIGFSPGLIREMFDPEMILNDIDEGCVNVLEANFTEASIFNKDFRNLSYDTLTFEPDVVFLDQSHFTANKDTTGVLNWAERAKNTLLLTDVFCFSLKPFNETRYDSYLTRMNELLAIAGKSIDQVFLYPNKNAAIIKAGNKPPGAISVIEYTQPAYIEQIYGPTLNL